MHSVAGITVYGHMPVMCNVYIQVFLVTLLIAVSSCEVCIVT